MERDIEFTGELIANGWLLTLRNYDREIKIYVDLAGAVADTIKDFLILPFDDFITKHTK